MFNDVGELIKAKGFFLIKNNERELRKHLEYIYSKNIEELPIDYSYIEIFKRVCSYASVPKQITKGFIKDYFRLKDKDIEKLESINLFLMRIYKIDLLTLLSTGEEEYKVYQEQIILPYFQRRSAWILKNQEKLRGA